MRLDAYRSLGVIEDKPAPERAAVTGLVDSLDAAFEMPGINKAAIVKLIQEYLPNFAHIETKKGLDAKM